jgi:ornithine cyclodeaminase/alanine dehydrogenase-like protein (mu-crystallin family)
LTILLDRAAVRATLRWPDVISAVRGAYLAAAGSSALSPVSSHLPLPGGAMHLKAGGTGTPALASVKANMRPDTGSASGLLLLYDLEDWSVRSILDSADLTAWRTAAAAVVGARALGAEPGTVVSVLGAGPLAHATVQAIRHEFGECEVHVWSRSPEHASALGPGVFRVHTTPEEAVRDAGLVITCTPSRQPLIESRNLRRDAVVCALGADSPGKRELAPDALAGAFIVSDNLRAARTAGEIAALDASAEEVRGEIGGLLTGTLSPPDGRGRRIFDSVGVAHVDTAVAAAITEAARQSHVGAIWDPASASSLEPADI